MPVIPAPHEHLQNGLDAAAEHIAHHRARIAAHEAEIDALNALREDYTAALHALGHTAILNGEQPADLAALFTEVVSADVARIPIIEPTFDEVVSTMSGRLTVFDEHGRLQV